MPYRLPALAFVFLGPIFLGSLTCDDKKALSTDGGGVGGGGGGGGAAAGSGGAAARDGSFAIPEVSLGALLDAGIIGVCPANPQGRPCGGPGMPLACLSATGGGAGAGCLCLQQMWFCPGATDAGLPAPPACPANVAGMPCMMTGALCTRPVDGGGAFCACIPQNNTLTWRCGP
jgi:hypothetical protein